MSKTITAIKNFLGLNLKNFFSVFFFSSEILVPETPGKVTICNSTYCDVLPATNWCPLLYNLHAYVTSENGDRFQHSVTKFRLNLGHSGKLKMDIFGPKRAKYLGANFFQAQTSEWQ